jgi:purine-nucleoside phosphorylase
LHNYDITSDDVVRLGLGCEPQDIRSEVIVTPIWGEDVFSDCVDRLETVTEGSVYDISYQSRRISFVRSGIGAPQTGDIVLALSGTPCRNLIFIGSVGGLTDALTIGDLVLVAESIGGDGFSSYLEEGELTPGAFLKSSTPEPYLHALLEEHAASICAEAGVVLNKGVVFSTDTIVAQFHHLDSLMTRFGCIGIEMETSAVFNAARLVGIRAAALLQLSDVIPARQSLFSGRTMQDHQRRRDVRRSVLSRIVLDTLCEDRWD